MRCPTPYPPNPGPRRLRRSDHPDPRPSDRHRYRIRTAKPAGQRIAVPAARALAMPRPARAPSLMSQRSSRRRPFTGTGRARRGSSVLSQLQLNQQPSQRRPLLTHLTEQRGSRSRPIDPFTTSGSSTRRAYACVTARHSREPAVPRTIGFFGAEDTDVSVTATPRVPRDMTIRLFAVPLGLSARLDA